ncbi:ABC transporter permease [Diplocloster agilis]|uniref:ABC transporter permease n=1 Tax=Diplocloster agilis TaxID=2850323 RepID=UPI000821AA69|nr:ABC transporter permease [Suonthocola fibrivorans]MCU6736013.1 ABC transporter permease [Suonthocola fibrivorans]SCJ85332.1 Ribose transport system permease protein rbsC [uncultured Clostridium sp.]
MRNGTKLAKHFSMSDHLLKFGVLYLLVLLIAVASMMSRQFLTAQNALNVLRQVSPVIILALGEGIVIITAGIDLSVGALVAMSGMIAAGAVSFWNLPTFAAVLLAVLFGIVFGLLNGIIIAKFNISAMIVTLATMNAARGAAYLYNDGAQIIGLPDSFTDIGRGYLGPIPIPAIIMIILVILMVLLMNQTVLGKYLYAIGGNEEVARLAGIGVLKTKITAYAICSMFAALAGVIYAARMNMGDPAMGEGLEMYAIASVILGGINLYGGQGSILGAVIGAMFITVLGNALNLNGVSSFWQLVVKAVALIVAALIYTKKKV